MPPSHTLDAPQPVPRCGRAIAADAALDLLHLEAVAKDALDILLREANAAHPQHTRLEAIEQVERAGRGKARDASGVVGTAVLIEAVEAAQIENERAGRANGQPGKLGDIATDEAGRARQLAHGPRLLLGA